MWLCLFWTTVNFQQIEQSRELKLEQSWGKMRFPKSGKVWLGGLSLIDYTLWKSEYCINWKPFNVPSLQDSNWRCSKQLLNYLTTCGYRWFDSTEGLPTICQEYITKKPARHTTSTQKVQVCKRVSTRCWLLLQLTRGTLW